MLTTEEKELLTYYHNSLVQVFIHGDHTPLVFTAEQRKIKLQLVKKLGKEINWQHLTDFFNHTLNIDSSNGNVKVCDICKYIQEDDINAILKGI